MSTRNTMIAMLVLLLVAVLLNIVFASRLPEIMATHWGIDGQADGFSERSGGIWFVPGMMLFTGLLLLGIPAIDPLKRNIEEFRPVYNWFVLATTGFLFFIHIFALTYNLGFQWNANLLLAPVIAVFIYAASYLLERTKRNWFIGVRTPWTLSNDEVWARTNQRMALLFKGVALISLLGMVFPDAYFFLLMIPMLTSVVYILVYSYVIYRKIN
jgi:uncharacterized membrane protein